MDDKLISNISYTNKDFQQIYPELLDLVKKLSNKWDPSLSNESDPGVLLLKLNALIADKNNYNIDKNVLECFPTSVTQEGNARKLYDSLGYKMHWYQSATSTITLQLKSTDNLGSLAYVTIPLFSMVCDPNSSTVYTIYKGVEADNVNENPNDIILSCLDLSRTYKARVIEGKCKSYEINGDKNITLDKLDSDYRLYFDEPNIAENGIFVKTNSSRFFGDWQPVDNLQLQRLGTCCFKFGVLPNSNTCYIQFPEDIASLLNTKEASALNINYVLSSGSKGNIKSSYLKTFLDDVTVKVTDNTGAENDVIITNQIAIVQPNGTINGADPETVDEAYTNYKRTVGTFDTLVTRKDYENAIYNATSTDGVTNLVSNVVVSDRTSDLNSTLKVQSWSPTYSVKSTLVLNNNTSWNQNTKETQNDNSSELVTPKPALDAYDIVFYALSTGDGSYESTFEPNSSDEYFKALLQNFLETNKSVQHNLISLNDLQNITNALYFIYKNIYALKGQIVTYERVTPTEAAEIEDNVMRVLKAKYNSRNLVFGDEVDYSTLLDTIQNADSRIKTIALDMPKYQIHTISNGHESVSTDFGRYSVQNNTIKFDIDDRYKNLKNETSNIKCKSLNFDEKLTLVARMILAGNVQLFKFDNGFTYDFGYDDVKSVRELGDNNTIIPQTYNLTSADTETEIVLVPYSADDANETEYEVKPNELIQAYAPSYIVKKTYTNYVRVVYYKSSTVADSLYKPTSQSNFITSSMDFYDSTHTKLSIATLKGILLVDHKTREEIDTYLTQNSLGQFGDYFFINGGSIYIRPDKLGIVCDWDDFWTDNKPTINTLFNFVTDDVTIKAGTNYVITNDDVFKLYYKDENGIQKTDKLDSGTIIQPSIDLSPKATLDPESVNSDDEIILTAAQTLNIMDINKCEISSGYSIYGYLNRQDNRLNLEPGDSIILQEGEYLLYKLNSTSDIIMYGAGTQLTSTGTRLINTNWEKIDVNNFEIEDIPWKSLQDNQSLECTELEVVSASPGSKVRYESSEQTPLIITNELQELSSGKLIITPATQGDSNSSQVITVDTYPNKDGTYGHYKVQSTLNLYQNNYGYQELMNDWPEPTLDEDNHTVYTYSSSCSRQSIKFKYSLSGDVKTATIIGHKNVYFNAVMFTSGGNDIDLITTRDGVKSYSLDVYTFNTTDAPGNVSLARDDKGILTITPFDNIASATPVGEHWHKLVLPIKFNKKLNEDASVLSDGWFIQTNINNASGEFKVAFTTEYTDPTNDSTQIECNIGLFTPYYTEPSNLDVSDLDTSLANIQIDKSGSYILWVPNDYDYNHLNIYFQGEKDSDNITFGKIKRLNGLNSDEIDVIPDDDNGYSKYDEFRINDEIVYKLTSSQTEVMITGDDFIDMNNDEKVATLNKKYGYNIFRKIDDLIKNSSDPSVQYDYTYEVPASDKVLQPTLSSSFFNKNHWANPYTIPQINLDKSTIKVNSYSIKA